MKVKIHIIRDVEVEINDPAIAELDTFWRNAEPPVPHSPELDAMIDKAVLAVEQATGISFGDKSASETITGIYAMDDEPIIEWG